MSLLDVLLPGLRRQRPTSTTATGTVLPGSPDAVEVRERCVRVGDGYTATLAVVGYPAEVGAGWLVPLTSFPGLVDLSLHIEPVPPVVAADRLRKQRSRMESSRRVASGKGRLDDPELEAAAADAAQMAHRVARGESRLFRTGIYLGVHGDSEADVADRVAEVRSVASSLLLQTAPVTWRQLQGWITTLPLAVDAIGVRRIFDTDALAASFPFTSPDLPTTAQDSGLAVLYGLNLASSGVVVWDRWAQPNYNAIILARSGEGKSHLAKLDLLRNLYLNIEAFVVDPADEYVRLALAVGGTIIRLGNPGVRINPLDLARGDDNALRDRAAFMQTFVAVLINGDRATTEQTLSGDEAAALDVAVLAAYRGKGITSDPRTWRRPAPLLSDVAEALATVDEHGRRLAVRLRPYVHGSFKDLFDGSTTTPAEGHLVVYAIKDLPDELQPVGTLLALDTIARTIKAAHHDGDGGDGPRQRRMVLVDEAWKLLSTGLGGKFLEDMAKSVRKDWAGLTVVTQDVADVLSTKVGRAVASNAATQILLRQGPQAIDAVAEAFGLTNGEREFLTTCSRGDALLACGTARVAFRAVASDAETHLVATGPATGR